MQTFLEKYGCAFVITSAVFIAAGMMAGGIVGGDGLMGNCCFLVVFLALLAGGLLLSGRGNS